MSLGLRYKNEKHIFDEKVVNGIPFLSYPMLEDTGIVKHGFSTRLGRQYRTLCNDEYQYDKGRRS